MSYPDFFRWAADAGMFDNQVLRKAAQDLVDTAHANGSWSLDSEIRKLEEALISSLTPTVSAEPSTKWASPALDRAYRIVEQLRDDLAQHPESGIDESLRRALEAIETADCELVGVAS